MNTLTYPFLRSSFVWRKAPLFLSLLFALSVQLTAQDVSISTKIDPAEIYIGEQALITLKIRTSDLNNTFLIVPPDTALQRAEALSFVIKDTVDINATVKEITAEMAVTSFDSTLVEIPAFGVRVGNQQFFADPLYLKVVMPKVDIEHPNNFSDIKEIWSLPYTWREIFLLALPWLLAICLLLGSFFLYRYLKKRWLSKRHNTSPSPTRNELSPMERLCKELESLPRGIGDNTYYTKLDTYWRTFLSHEAIFPEAMKMTPYQLIDTYKKSLFAHSISITSLLEEVSYRTLMSKYADYVYDETVASKDKLHILEMAQKIWDTHITKEEDQK